MTAVLTLDARLDLSAVRPLAQRIGACDGADLSLDAGGVTHLGALAAQLLVAARQRWASAGLRLEVGPRSPAFDEAVAVMGLDRWFGAEDAR